jgi:hypothetical protein
MGTGFDAHLIVNAESLVRVLNELMHRECSVVRLDDGIGDLGGWDNREGGHHAIWELFANLGDQQCSHASTSTSTERVSDLETLEAVAALSFTTDDVENLVNEFCSLGVVAFGPVVSGTRLAKDEVIRTEQLTERTSSDSIHCARFEVDENSARDIFVVGCLQGVSEHSSTMADLGCRIYLVEVHIHALQLKVRGAIVAASYQRRSFLDSVMSLTRQSRQGHARQR